MTRTELVSLLIDLDARPTTAAYAKAAKRLAESDTALEPLRIALLASFTIDPLVPYLHVEAARRGFAADLYIAPYNSVRRELLDPASGCAAHRPHLVFIAQLLEDVSPRAAAAILDLDRKQSEAAIDEILSDLTRPLDRFRSTCDSTLVIHNFAQRIRPQLGIYEASAVDSQSAWIRRLNTRLGRALTEHPAQHLLDFDRLCADVGYQRWRNPSMWYLGRAPLATEALRELAGTYGAFLQATHSTPKKVLVLDLDNTLWGGVIGEDGLAGIHLGHDYPGNVYRQFQATILDLYRRGVVLAISSKNNPADVDEVFTRHSDMILRPEHFAARRVNWAPKPRNLAEIAVELDLGLDSFVFFDDSPIEREQMRQAHPDVEVLEVPATPIGYEDCLLRHRWFDQLSLTEEDRGRGKMYRARASRRELRDSVTDLDGYLADLDTTIAVTPCDAASFDRVHSLLAKTNQFNLTTRRISRQELASLLEDPTAGIFCLRVSDRFGDSGLVGAAIVKTEGREAILDSFLLSCRVIGRAVETALLCRVVDWCRAQNAVHLLGEFRPTAKNTPAAGFLEEHGFERQVSTGQVFTKPASTRHSFGDGEASFWKLDLRDELPFTMPSHIRDLEKDESH